MSASMAAQGGRVQLQQSDMRLVLNMPKMAQGGFLRAAIEEIRRLIKIPRAKVVEDIK
jgi:tRNA threonylcarbamoyladenosine modification (KEOPS) complex  Pcc1 subunit